MANFLTPPELSKTLVVVGEGKASLPAGKMFLLGILAGAYIGFGAHLATTVATGSCEWIGLQRFLTGAVFSVGLMLVIIPGSELWTGNNLMAVALLEKKISFARMMRNWVFVYAGNLVGAVMLAFLIARGSGLLAGPVGGTAITLAVEKTSAATSDGLGHNIAFFFRAVGCNWLVCLAVMMAMAAQDIGGKIWGVFFPIMAFVASGFEHSVANMYFIPAGLLAKSFPSAVAASGKNGEVLAGLNWTAMFTQNIGAVTLGNFVGGFLFTGTVYWWLFVRKDKTPQAAEK
ncbi:MAG: formate/nitrite transporter family protein [Planctomycetota bacterium]